MDGAVTLLYFTLTLTPNLTGTITLNFVPFAVPSSTKCRKRLSKCICAWCRGAVTHIRGLGDVTPKLRGTFKEAYRGYMSHSLNSKYPPYKRSALHNPLYNPSLRSLDD